MQQHIGLQHSQPQYSVQQHIGQQHSQPQSGVGYFDRSVDEEEAKEEAAKRGATKD
jgi:hypothetical protein